MSQKARMMRGLSRAALRAGLRAGLGLAVAGGASAAAAQDGAAQETVEVEEIVVTAPYAGSLRGAQQTKRDAAYSTDAVNAEDIGRFPAQNAAEAIQLVTGVTISRQRGEGLHVSVRGLGPRYQNVTLNGRSIAVNDLIENGGVQGRNFRFEVLPSEFISQIEVIKTPTADMNEGAIGGNVDVKTFLPLDIGRRVVASARGAYNTLSEDTTPTVSGLASWTNQDRTFGVLASAMVMERSVRNDRLYGFGWNLDRFTGANGPLAAGLYTPTRTRPTVELEDRERVSATFAAQWRPTPELETRLDVLYTRLDVDFDEFGIDIYPDDRTFARPEFVAGSERIVGDTVVAGRIDNVRWMASRETSLNRHELSVIGLHQRWSPGAWTFDADAVYSSAHSYHPDMARATVRSRIAFFGPLEFDYSRGFEHMPTLRADRSLTDPANFVGQAFDVAPKDSLDTDWSVQLDATRAFRDGPLTQVMFGAQAHERYRNYWRRDYVVNGVLNTPVTSLGANFLDPFPVSGFLADFAGDAPREWLAPSGQAFFDLLFTPDVEGLPLSAGDLRNAFKVKEEIATAYVRGDFAFTLAGLPVSGNLGLRYAQTRQTSSGHQTTGTAAEPVSFAKTYGDWLPSLNLRVELSDDLIGRFAASRVVSRPNIVDLAPRLSVSRDSPSASGGNPNLDPFLATQADVSLEWYFADAGSLTAAAFYKVFDAFITRENSIIQIPGRGDVTLSSSVNGGDVELFGLEAAYQQVFDFLPAPFDGLGVRASLSIVDTRADYTVGTRVLKDEISGLSPLSYNVLGFYERGPFSARLGYFWRDAYMNGTGSTSAAPSTVDAFGSLDGQVSYQLSDRMTLFVEGINLTDAPKLEYAGDESRGLELNSYGRTFTFGVRARF